MKRLISSASLGLRLRERTVEPVSLVLSIPTSRPCIVVHPRPHPRGHLAIHRGFSSGTASSVATDAPESPPEPQPESPPEPFRLRDYQEECIQSVLASLEKGHKRLGISLATGSGKTVIFTQLIDRVEPLSETASQTLILAHRRELVEQAARHCTSAYPDKTIEVEMGKLSASGTADITVASLQSIVSGDRLLKFEPSRFKLVLVDEAHHIVAPGYLKVLRHLGLGTKQPDSPHLVGVSATFSRFDGLRLGAAIDEIVYHKDYVDMISSKWLSDVIFTTVQSTADLRGVKTTGPRASGDFDAASLSRVMNTDAINDVAIRAWHAKAGTRKSTLVFCVDLAHVAAMTQRFRHYGYDARFVTGDTPPRERSERLDAFKRGEFPVLVNCGVFTEGTDIPNIDCVLLARPTKSRNLLVQMIGRGMRLFPGKENCHIIDMVSSLQTGIVSTPTLFGLDPDELVDAASVEGLGKLRAEKVAEKALQAQRTDAVSFEAPRRAITFTDYDTVFDLIADTSGEKHIHAISPNAWVHVGPGRYILTGPGGSFIRLEKVEDAISDTPVAPRFTAWEVRALPAISVKKCPWASPRELLTTDSFVDAVHGCDKYTASATEIYPFNAINRRMPWRNGPPSSGQLLFLNKLRTKSNQLGYSDITKGKAADMITKLKHGARGRFASLEAEKKRRAKASLAVFHAEQRKLHHVVSVGPVPS
ncbi:P-loop containing nucleoside triphosphate hydrolase protein [Cercophora scortea]|uniref:P-loop containing nucleoside triphosphate hydrolase protein n=1 Tax=Cercophora scortea TaxID=314031 RepID=A0AAE0IFX1_9PEZI|nr:P-loop containing nucleoside triphosphate hydrolase protein [Cercophora scortea]